ncbi:STOP protein (macronuclear) [Tetrahymena thermophila SB210]|uniref:STOP protein n=1 Tax=Tetrahymena thermophila (strain SB210) TaxID=312017 RepID=I7M186_TETTS|nr:STOP protein [Tetrahymena thermophila SB210]EAR95698.3 STOP protein [Tetrahymena thermophila SB210]|eukprot:XP_001015943.3 STOP protein [Tetrahymena thermophila SB210]
MSITQRLKKNGISRDQTIDSQQRIKTERSYKSSNSPDSIYSILSPLNMDQKQRYKLQKKYPAWYLQKLEEKEYIQSMNSSIQKFNPYASTKRANQRAELEPLNVSTIMMDNEKKEPTITQEKIKRFSQMTEEDKINKRSSQTQMLRSLENYKNPQITKQIDRQKNKLGDNFSQHTLTKNETNQPNNKEYYDKSNFNQLSKIKLFNRHQDFSNKFKEDRQLNNQLENTVNQNQKSLDFYDAQKQQVLDFKSDYSQSSQINKGQVSSCFDSEQIDPIVLECIQNGDWRSLLPDDLKDSQINMEDIFENNLDYFLHLICQCACFKCKCGSCKCEAVYKLKLNCFKQSSYFKDFQPKIRYDIQPHITDQIRSLKQTGQQSVNNTTTNQRDYQQYKIEHQKQFPAIQKEHFRSQAPISYHTSYKSQFQNWGQDQGKLDFEYQYTTSNKIRFEGQSSYRDHYGIPFKTQYQQTQQRFHQNKTTSPYSRFAPFIGETSYNTYFKPADESQNIFQNKENKQKEVDITPSYLGQFTSQYQFNHSNRNLPFDCTVRKLKRLWQKQYQQNYQKYQNSKSKICLTEPI